MSVHPPLGLAHRCQVHAAVGPGSPVHSALATRSPPTCAAPLIVGACVIDGAVAARAATGTSINPSAATAAGAPYPKGTRIDRTSMSGASSATVSTWATPEPGRTSRIGVSGLVPGGDGS